MKKWNVGWGVISQCNMNCRFCYSKSKRGDSKDLNYDDWVRFIDENHFQINSINYGTGENTLVINWFRLVAYIRNKYPEIKQALTTNGYLSEAIKNPFCLDAFVHAIDEVDVSLDFYDAERHTKFRGQPKAYQWAMTTLDLCKQYGKSTTIVFLGSKKNITHENIDGLFSIASNHDAILRMNMFRPTESIDDFSKQFIVDYDTFVDALTYIARKYSIISLNDALFSTILTNETINDPSGDRSIRVFSDGSITPSTYLIDDEFIIANIKEKEVLRRIEQDQSITRIISKIIPQECEGCLYKEKCAGGVYDRRYLWFGTLDKKDPYCPGPFAKPSHEKIDVKKQVNFNSVHDGYLPTCFFKP